MILQLVKSGMYIYFRFTTSSSPEGHFTACHLFGWCSVAEGRSAMI